MEKIMSEIIISNILIILAIGIIIQAIKNIIPDNATKYLELISVVLGVVLTMAYHGIVLTYALNGVIVGFAAGKMYDKIVDSIIKHIKSID